jgi:hypothetical protein
MAAAYMILLFMEMNPPSPIIVRRDRTLRQWLALALTRC